MSLKYNGNAVTTVVYNNQDVKQIVYNGNTAWCKPFTYTQGTLPTGVASLTCVRASTSEPTASTGALSNGDTIYYGDTLYWTATASTGYNVSVTHGSSSPVTVTGNITGTSSSGVSASVKSYKLSISVTNSEYGTYSVSRTSSPLAGASTGALSHNATIYYGDVLTASHSPNANSSTSWGAWGTVTAPTVTSTGAATSGNITVTNKDSATCTLYYQTSSSGYSGTSLGSTAANGTQTKTGLSFNTTYYCYATKTVTRNGFYYQYTDSSTYNGTNGVTGNVTASFSFGVSSVDVTDSTTGYSSLTSHKTATQNSYTITFNKPTYGSWDSSTKTAYYGDYISVSGTTVICKIGGSSGSERWRNTCTRTADTAQYSYWLSIDSGYGVTITGNYTITTSSGRDVRYYTVTWKYRNGYDSWTTTTTSVAYGSSPSAPVTPSTVTSGSYRRVPGSWDNTSSITGERTINMTYTDQVYITCSGTRCSSSNSGWYNTGSSFVAEWTANNNCAFALDEDEGETTDQLYIQVGTTPATYSKSADYIYVQISNGTGCSANVSTGWDWYAYNYQVTWTRTSGYAFDSSGTTTATANLTSPGSTYSKSCTYGYMTISASNCSANYSSGWYALSGNNYTVTFTANSGYDFNGSSTTTVTQAVPNTFSATATATVVESWNTVTNTSTMVITNTSYWECTNRGSLVEYKFKTAQTKVSSANLRITIGPRSGLYSSPGVAYKNASYKFTSPKVIYANEGYVTVYNDGSFDYDIMVAQDNSGYVYVFVRTVDEDGWEDVEYFTTMSTVAVELYY